MNILALLAASAAAAVPQQAPVPADDPKPIIVTAKRLDATEKALKDCIARGCPPDQEIDAALAHAENLFVYGEYFDARRTLMTTIGHVDKRAKDYPEAVGDIWRAQSRIAAHMGEREDTRMSQFKSLDALRSGMDNSDSRVFGQRIAVADTLAREGRVDLATNAFRDIASDARKKNQPLAQGTALLRVALIQASLYEMQPVAFGRELNRAIDALLATTDPVPAVYRDAARLLRARLAIKPGDTAAIDRLVADYAPPGANRPILLYQPPLPDEQPAPRTLDGRPGQARANASFEGQWADVAFRIRPDGRVEDVDVARESKALDRSWIEPMLASIAGRRYAPMTLRPGNPSLRRVERYTLTAYWEVPTATRLRQRGYPRIEMLDLSNDVASQSPAPTGIVGSTPAN
ncbi:MAG: hypothetical protein V4537_15565 [Pseudomonadota bacterium]